MVSMVIQAHVWKYTSLQPSSDSSSAMRVVSGLGMLEYVAANFCKYLLCRYFIKKQE